MKSKKSAFMVGLILIILSLLLAISSFPNQSVLQYMIDNEMITETFDSPEEVEQRANELRAEGITFYHSFN